MDAGLLPVRQEIQPHLVYDASGLVAFSVYRKLLIAGRPAIYRSGTSASGPSGPRLYGFTTEILRSLGVADGAMAASFMGGAPAIHRVGGNAGICEQVTPSLLRHRQDTGLQAACVEMCTLLYPGRASKYPA